MDIKADLFEGGFEILADFLSENVGIGQTIGFFAAFVPEPETVRAGIVATDSEDQKSVCFLFTARHPLVRPLSLEAVQNLLPEFQQ